MSGYVLQLNPGGGGGPPEDAADQFLPPPLDDGIILATSLPGVVSLTASATPHAAGAWVEVEASLSADSGGIHIGTTNSYNSSTVSTASIFEIGIGAGGAEVVWAQILVGYILTGAQLYVPGFIAAGTRVAMRARSVVISKVFAGVNVRFAGVRVPAIPAPVMYGIDTTASKGVSLVHAGAINTKGAWAQIVAATSAEHNLLALFPQPIGADTGSGILFDVGIGAAGLETVLIPNIYVAFSATEGMSFWLPSPLCFGVDIPVGSRLSARYQTSRSTTLDNMSLSLVAA